MGDENLLFCIWPSGDRRRKWRFMINASDVERTAEGKPKGNTTPATPIWLSPNAMVGTTRVELVLSSTSSLLDSNGVYN